MRKQLLVHYDKKRDVLYVTLGKRATVNLPWGENEDVRVDVENCEIAGFIITNFHAHYPKLAEHLNPKDRWFVQDFFMQRLEDWNNLLAPFKSKKRLMEFLIKERANLSSEVAHH